MAHTLSLPDNYAWVLLTGTGVGWLTMWQAVLVSRYRRRAGVPYPQAYAEKAEVHASKDAMKFNCVQRAHMNTMEAVPQTLFFLLFSGLKYPVLSASFGAAWLLGRVIYTLGYATGEPKKRQRGAIHNLGFFGLMLTSTWTAGQLALSTLSI